MSEKKDEKKAGSAPASHLPKAEERPAIAEPGKKPEIAKGQSMELVGHMEELLLGKPKGADSEQKADADKRKIKELEERCMRLQAEFENYQKRTARESEALRQNSGADIILKLLPVMDEFDIAMSHVDKSSHKDFKQGMEMIYSKLRDMLRKEGAEPYDALGAQFDPYRHDAIRQGEGEAGKVVEVVQKGYSYKGKILRHAKVVVGKGKEGAK